MIQQILYNERYDWEVVLFYDVTPRYDYIVLDTLWDFGIAPERYYTASKLLHSGVRNEGLTYSNIRDRRSVVVIGRVTDVGEFINSCTHEVDHLADHICKHYGIPLGSEENAYLHGDLMQQIVTEAASEVGGVFKEAMRYVLNRMR